MLTDFAQRHAQATVEPTVGQRTWFNVIGYDKAVECEFVYSGIMWQQDGPCRKWVSSQLLDVYRTLNDPRAYAQVDLSQPGFTVTLFYELNLYLAENLQTRERFVREPGGEYVAQAVWEQQQAAAEASLSAARQAQANATAEAAAEGQRAAADATAQADAVIGQATATAEVARIRAMMAERESALFRHMLKGPCESSAFGCSSW